jgi:hypothetical protein
MATPIESGQLCTVVRIDLATNTTVLSAMISSMKYGSIGGYVLYQDNSKLYVWSAAGGAKVLLDAVPGGGHTLHATTDSS